MRSPENKWAPAPTIRFQHVLPRKGTNKSNINNDLAPDTSVGHPGSRHAIKPMKRRPLGSRDASGVGSTEPFKPGFRTVRHRNAAGAAFPVASEVSIHS